MSLLAHLSDLHLLERDHHKRRGLARQRLSYLSTGSPLDAEARMRHTAATLQSARRAGADHVLITGDLTEDGVDAQFEVLAEVLHASGLDPQCVTLLPGNHDGYVDSHAFTRALAGPLSAFRKTSAAGAYTVLPEAVIAPISTVIENQWFTHSRGVVRDEDVLAIRRLASDRISRERALVIGQHHPPSHHPLLPMEWIDGTKNAQAMRELLLERTRVHVLHGHVHKQSTKHFSGRSHAQVFCTGSVRDEFERGLALRFYQAEDGMLHEIAKTAPIAQPLAARLSPMRVAFAGAPARRHGTVT